jgi:hypothetical protein
VLLSVSLDLYGYPIWLYTGLQALNLNIVLKSRIVIAPVKLRADYLLYTTVREVAVSPLWPVAAYEDSLHATKFVTLVGGGGEFSDSTPYSWVHRYIHSHSEYLVRR